MVDEAARISTASIWQGAILQAGNRPGQKTVCMAVRADFALQMGDGCELDVQSAAAFAQRNEELSYWQLQVWLLMAMGVALLPTLQHKSYVIVCVCMCPSLSSGLQRSRPHQR